MPPVDGVAITAGSGTTILTDDTGAGGHAQVVKLAIATDGSGTLIPADGTDGLLVNLGGNNDVTVTGTVTANLAAGTNNIGDVDVLSIAAGDNNIGNVDIVTVPAPLSTTGAGTEATALRVTIATDSTGVLSVDDNGAALTVDNGGTFAVQVDGSALTALQLIDDPVQVLGTDTYTEASSKGVTIGAVRRDADTTLVNTTNEFGPLQMDANGRLKVEAFSGEALPVTFTGSTDVATQTTLASVLTAAQLIDDPVFADDAAFTVGTSKVNMSGVQAVAHGATPDTADALDAVAWIANRHRVPFMLGGHPNLQSSEYFTSGAITDDNILPAISAGTIYVITGITVACSAANATQPSVRIGFGASTLTAQGATNADAVSKIVLSHPGIAAGSGIVKGYNGGIVGIGGDGEELRITCSTPTTSLIVQVDWFTIAS